MPMHIIQQGEYVARLAERYGFTDFHSIWDDPRNSELKEERKNPNVLLPGDKLFIPDLQKKEQQCPTGRVHTFQIGRKKVMLRLVVRDFDGLPVANTLCQLDIEGGTHELTTDANGRIEKEIPASAEEGFLRIPELDLECPLKIGHLDPLEEESGWTARLVNLGYLYRQEGQVDEETLSMAVEEFQCDHELPVTGTLDERTKSKLKELHGC